MSQEDLIQELKIKIQELENEVNNLKFHNKVLNRQVTSALHKYHHFKALLDAERNK